MILRPKQNNLAIAFSSKDRPSLSAKTILPLLEAEDVDVFWFDGSRMTINGQLPKEYAGYENLKEIHLNVTGGPDAAITFALDLLQERGYEYIGLLENDVLLHKGWEKRIRELFDIKDVNVGAAGVRCFASRILERGGDYAVMSNLGAGMVVFRGELIQHILMNYRQPMLYELQTFFKHFTGKDYPIPHVVKKQDPEAKKPWRMTCDWWFDAVLLSQGYRSVACIPSMATDLDDVGGDILVTEAA